MSDRLMPADWQRGPSYGGAYTFARIPASRDLGKADVAIVGVPMDMAVSFRTGARMGPRGIRDASGQILPHLLSDKILAEPFASLRVIDYGDLDVVPGYLERSHELIEEGLSAIVDAGVFPLVLGGDHSTTLPVLRACAKKHGVMSLLHVDAHPDFWPLPEGKYQHHGTVFHTAAQEGLIDPHASVQIGIRGSYSATIVDTAREAGFHVVTADDFFDRGRDETLARVREIIKKPAYFSFDIDSVDPAFAPGTGTPEVAGLTSRDAVEIVRGVAGLGFVGFDMVEVAPPYDSAEITSLLAANLVHEFLLTLAKGTSAD